MVSFVVYDLIFLVLFTIGVVLFLYSRKQKLEREGILYLYKTSVGIKIMDKIAKKHPKLMRFMSYIIVATGYLLMIGAFYLIFQLITVFMNPAFVKIIKIPPIAPLIPYLPSLFQITWLPPFYFTYWIIAIAIVAIAHEGFHGIFARFYNVKIKSTGFGFLGPLLAFFVEQDDKQLQKSKNFNQLVIVAAGVFANVLCTILFGIIMILFLNGAYASHGVIFNDYTYSVAPFAAFNHAVFTGENLKVDGSNLTRIKLEGKYFFVSSQILDSNYTNTLENDTSIKLYWDEPAIRSAMKGAIVGVNNVEITRAVNISQEISRFKPGDNITITTRVTEANNTISLQIYNITLGSDYLNTSRPIIGTATMLPASSTSLRGIIYGIMSYFRDPTLNYEPRFDPELTIFLYNLLLWLVLISFSVAITNMLPVGIFDGGRFFYVSVLAVTGSKKIAEKSFKFMTWLLLAVVAWLMFLWVVGIF